MADLANIVERLSSLTVIEAGELAKMLEEKWGVSAAAPVTAVQQLSPEEKPPEQTEFDVILTGFGEAKVQVIKEVRSITQLGLKEAMALANEVPKPLKTAVGRAEADRIKAVIEGVGGTVEIQ